MKWTKHDSDAHDDARIKKVLRNYGLEGYGLYWYCIELITKNVNKNNLSFALEDDAVDIAHSARSTEQKVSEMMRYFVEIGLFEEHEGKITCLKIASRLDKSMTGNDQMRQIIAKIKGKTAINHDGIMISHDGIMISHDRIMTESENIMQEERRREEKRLDKNRLKDSCPPTEDLPPKKPKPKIPNKYLSVS